MNLRDHANRYYKSLCTCQYPYRSKFARDICGACGGIIPSWRRVEVETREARRVDVLFVVAVILLMLGLLLFDRLNPSVLDGAFNLIGR